MVNLAISRMLHNVSGEWVVNEFEAVYTSKLGYPKECMRTLNSFARDIQESLTCESYEQYKDGFYVLP